MKRLLIVAAFAVPGLLACDGKPPGTPTSLSVTAVVPMSASAFAGERVIVSGAGFRPGVTVTFGGSPAAIFNLTPTALTVTTPSSPMGKVDVVVTNPNGEETRIEGFEFLDFQVTAVEQFEDIPPTFVTIHGAGFRPGARVLIGGEVARIGSITSRTIRADAPFMKAGKYDVEVISPEGRSTVKAAGVEYLPVTLALDRTTVAPGGVLRVTWKCEAERLIDDFRPIEDFLTIARATDPGGIWLWERGVPLTGSADVVAPNQPGEYEMRILLARQLYTAVPFTVTDERP